jgi:hypothetical protein
VTLKRSNERPGAGQYRLFDEVLKALHDAAILRHLVLVGGWCLYFYRLQNGNPPHIPAIRTMDIDILVPSRYKPTSPVDLVKVLAALGFDRAQDPFSGHMKLVHPELEIEFLTPELGRGSMEPLEVRPLSINAQRLRYLQLLQDQTAAMTYKGMAIRIPTIEAFLLHKILVYHNRKNFDKKRKDREIVRSLAEHAAGNPLLRQQLQALFSGLPPGWRKQIIANAGTMGLRLLFVPITSR